MLCVVLMNFVKLIVMAPFVTSARLFLLGQLLGLANSKWLRTRLEIKARAMVLCPEVGLLNIYVQLK
jgi:hypothetical protein